MKIPEKTLEMKQFRLASEQEAGQSDASGGMRWLLTYADLITLLMAFFVMMYAISKVDTQRYQGLVVALKSAFSGVKLSCFRKLRTFYAHLALTSRRSLTT